MRAGSGHVGSTWCGCSTGKRGEGFRKRGQDASLGPCDDVVHAPNIRRGPYHPLQATRHDGKRTHLPATDGGFGNRCSPPTMSAAMRFGSVRERLNRMRSLLPSPRCFARSTARSTSSGSKAQSDPAASANRCRFANSSVCPEVSRPHPPSPSLGAPSVGILPVHGDRKKVAETVRIGVALRKISCLRERRAAPANAMNRSRSRRSSFGGRL